LGNGLTTNVEIDNFGNSLQSAVRLHTHQISYLMKHPLRWLTSAILLAHNAQAQTYLDPAFGSNGKVFTTFTTAPTTDVAAAGVLQADGKLVVVGQGAAGLEIARYTTTGRLDADFGTGGKVITTIAPPPAPLCLPHGSQTNQTTYGACLQADGRLVVAGSVAGNSFISRFLINGDVDASFGTGGVAYICGGTVSGYAVRVGQQATGELLVMAHRVGVNVGSFPLPAGHPGVYRFWPNGSADNSYGGGNIGFSPAYSRLTDGLVESTGTTLWVGFQDGYFINSNAVTRQLIVVRNLPGGTPDPAFGTAGVAVLSQLNGAPVAGRAVAKTALGQLLVLGETQDAAPALFLARYNANGTPDPAFGTAGIVDLGPIKANDFTKMALQADGRVLLAGAINGDFALRRLLASGQPDATYGTNSYLTINEDTDDRLRDLFVQPDGNAVAVGYTAGAAGQNSRFAVLRALPATVSASALARGTMGATLRALPNPVSGETLHVEIDWARAVSSPVAVELLSPVGQVVAQAIATGTGSEHRHYTTALPATTLRAGIYLLRARANTDVLTRKVVVQ
jgi:uncharacterized delta-60 repeat protein